MNQKIITKLNTINSIKTKYSSALSLLQSKIDQATENCEWGVIIQPNPYAGKDDLYTILLEIKTYIMMLGYNVYFYPTEQKICIYWND